MLPYRLSQNENGDSSAPLCFDRYEKVAIGLCLEKVRTNSLKMKKLGLTKRTFSPEFKSRIQNKILSGELTSIEAANHYGISRTTIYRWTAEINQRSSDIKSMSKKKPSGTATKDELQARVEALEKTLEFEQLRTEAYKLLITEAEEKFKIQIEKKSGPK